jgi:hypothetical protein
VIVPVPVAQVSGPKPSGVVTASCSAETIFCPRMLEREADLGADLSKESSLITTQSEVRLENIATYSGSVQRR